MMQLEKRKGSRNGLWIVMVAAPSILLASGIKAGCQSSCGARTPAPSAPAGTITTTTPGIGGQPGAFSGSATVTAPQAQAPQTDFASLTSANNDIQKQIDALRGALDNRQLSPAERLEQLHKLDDLVNNKNALQYVIDAANAAASAPGKPNSDGRNDPKCKLDLVDGASALKGLFGK